MGREMGATRPWCLFNVRLGEREVAEVVGAEMRLEAVDSTVVRAHQHAAGALERGPQAVTNHPITHSDAPAAG
jgi:hypothetical protein